MGRPSGAQRDPPGRSCTRRHSACGRRRKQRTIQVGRALRWFGEIFLSWERKKDPFYPEEITRFTGEPCDTELPLAGSWLITWLITTVVLLCCVTVPTVSFAPVIAVVAAS